MKSLLMKWLTENQNMFMVKNQTKQIVKFFFFDQHIKIITARMHLNIHLYLQTNTLDLFQAYDKLFFFFPEWISYNVSRFSF